MKRPPREELVRAMYDKYPKHTYICRLCRRKFDTANLNYFDWGQTFAQMKTGTLLGHLRLCHGLKGRRGYQKWQVPVNIIDPEQGEI